MTKALGNYVAGDTTASEKEKDFLHAMARDDGPVAAGDIGKRLNVKSNVVANYRARLIAAGLIEAPAYGKVDFAIPGLREYLRKTRGTWPNPTEHRTRSGRPARKNRCYRRKNNCES